MLRQQERKARDREYQRLKAEGTEYEELREKLDKVTYPKPDAEIIEAAFEAFSAHNPWVTGFTPSPKSVARDMFERYDTFNQYVNEYNLERIEGMLLRYVTQAYKALKQNVPESFKTDAVYDVIEYLRGVIARADSSLLTEWETLRDGGNEEIGHVHQEEALDADPAAFRARVHAEMMQIVAALAARDYEEAASLLRPDPDAYIEWDAEAIERALEPFYDRYDALIFNHAARSRKLMRLDRQGPGLWEVTQVLRDPEGDDMWYLKGEIALSTLESPDARLVSLEYMGD